MLVKGQNDRRALLCRIIGPIRYRITEKSDNSWRRKRYFFTITSRRLTPPPLSLPNWSTYARYCFRIHRILQIWSHVTSFCLRTWGSRKFEKKFKNFCYRCYGSLFCRPPKDLLFKQSKEVGASMGEVHGPEMRVLRNKSQFFQKLLYSSVDFFKAH